MYTSQEMVKAEMNYRLERARHDADVAAARAARRMRRRCERERAAAAR